MIIHLSCKPTTWHLTSSWNCIQALDKLYQALSLPTLSNLPSAREDDIVRLWQQCHCTHIYIKYLYDCKINFVRKVILQVYTYLILFLVYSKFGQICLKHMKYWVHVLSLISTYLIFLARFLYNLQDRVFLAPTVWLSAL